MAITSRSPVVGIKAGYYAILTPGTDTATVPPAYGAVKELCGMAQFGFDPAFSQTTGYYNNSPMYVFSSHGEMSLNLSGDDIYPEAKAELLAQTYVGGVLYDQVTDTPPYAAFGGIMTRADGTEERFWFPKIQFAKGSVTVDTKGASVTAQNDTMAGRAVGLSYNGLFRARVRQGDTAISGTTFTNWLSQPVSAVNADLTAVTVTAAAGTAGQIVFTFTKSGGVANINSVTLTSTNLPIFITSSGAIQTPTAYTLATPSGSTQTLTVTGLTAGATSYYVSSNVKDVNAVGVTPKAGQVTVS